MQNAQADLKTNQTEFLKIKNLVIKLNSMHKLK